MKVHNLKIQYQFAKAIATGVKTFEIRYNDRDFKVNDMIAFQAIDIPDEDPYCIEALFERSLYRISYITDFEQKEGYVVMSIRELHIK